jgi:hypothetical protein
MQIQSQHPRENRGQIRMAHDLRCRSEMSANGDLWPRRFVREPLLGQLVDRRGRSREEEPQF